MEYTVTDLGTLGGSTSYADAINNNGQVTGDSYPSSGYPHAFLYSNGVMTDLGTLGGDQASQTGGINAAGVVVGLSYSPTSTAGEAFVYSNGTMAELATTPPGALYGATAINDAGQVVGAGLGPNAYLCTNGTLTNLGALPGTEFTAPVAINDSAQVVGYAEVNAINPPSYTLNHAFLYSNGTMTDLGSLPLPNYWPEDSTANGINASGQIVGVSATSSGYGDYEHAFLYSNGTMTDLGMPPGSYIGSCATGINASGQVVGYAYAGSGGIGTALGGAFVYSGGTMTDLNTLINPASGWALGRANAINDSGQIVGDGINPDGSLHGFLLTPVAPGDANGDGQVDINDLTIVLANFGQTGATWWQGDFTGDGTVDMNNLTTVLSNFGYGVTAHSPASVPEPSALALLALALLAPLVYAWRRRARQ